MGGLDKTALDDVSETDVVLDNEQVHTTHCGQIETKLGRPDPLHVSFMPPPYGPAP
jgi:hypothetical protein